MSTNCVVFSKCDVDLLKKNDIKTHNFYTFDGNKYIV